MLAHVDDAPAKLRRQHLDRLQVVALEAEGLYRGERRRLRCVAAVRGRLGVGGVLELLGEGGLALELGMLCVWLEAAWFVCGPADKLLLDVLGAEDGDFCEQELTLDAVRVRVVEDSPDRYLRRGREGRVLMSATAPSHRQE